MAIQLSCITIKRLDILKLKIKVDLKVNVVDVFVDDTTDWNETFYKDLKQQGRLDAEIQRLLKQWVIKLKFKE